MNQYDVDDYVLPRRRSPWVLVGGSCHPSLVSFTRVFSSPANVAQQYLVAILSAYTLRSLIVPCPVAGAGGTAAILLGGLLAFRRVSRLARTGRVFASCNQLRWICCLQGNQNLSQHMMRARVVAQVTSLSALLTCLLLVLHMLLTNVACKCIH